MRPVAGRERSPVEAEDGATRSVRRSDFPSVLRVPISARQIVAVQRTVGNRVVSRLVSMSAARVQRRVKYSDALMDLVEGEPLRPDISAVQQQARDHHETEVFVAEFRSLYPGIASDQRAEQLVRRAIDVLAEDFGDMPVTLGGIRRAITTAMAEFGGPPPMSGTPFTHKRADVAKFVNLLESRRGAYRWGSGVVGNNFQEWILGEAPADNPLLSGASLNCWEAVLAAAVESGLLPVEEVRSPYAVRDVEGAVRRLLLNRLPELGKPVHEHTDSFSNPARLLNDVQPGAIVMVHGEAGPLHHVVAAVGSSPADWRNIPVASLWKYPGTTQDFGLATAPFSSILSSANELPDPLTFRYVNL